MKVTLQLVVHDDEKGIVYQDAETGSDYLSAETVTAELLQKLISKLAYPDRAFHAQFLPEVEEGKRVPKLAYIPLDEFGGLW